MLRALYERGIPYPIEGVAATIPLERLALVGADVSSGAKRTVVVARIEHGVPSFQTLDVTFTAPG